jgi:hypothetical protein
VRLSLNESYLKPKRAKLRNPSEKLAPVSQSLSLTKQRPLPLQMESGSSKCKNSKCAVPGIARDILLELIRATSGDSDLDECCNRRTELDCYKLITVNNN